MDMEERTRRWLRKMEERREEERREYHERLRQPRLDEGRRWLQRMAWEQRRREREKKWQWAIMLWRPLQVIWTAIWGVIFLGLGVLLVVAIIVGWVQCGDGCGCVDYGPAGERYCSPCY